eukprot:TRINITY_DN5044_c0_g3_i1.p1 TRINITY_DN5044_c0_g3~~TRINITY_DN5044_c0_g3_i1.p1  ORF type:complete len:259 (+),score=23.67 TRINITY_DN5044_c0_g3_i1:214-990(+)
MNEKYTWMNLCGDQLFIISHSGRRKLVVLDQWLNELAWTSHCSTDCKMSLGKRLLTRLFDDVDGELYWIDARDRLVPTGVHVPVNDLVCVSQDEVAYCYDHDRLVRADGSWLCRVDVCRLDRDLRETCAQVFLPSKPWRTKQLVALDGRLLMLAYGTDESVGTLDLLVVGGQGRTHVDVAMHIYVSDTCPTTHQGRLFVPLDAGLPQLAVYCFNRDAALLWHACFPLTGFPRGCWVLVLPDGRLVAAMSNFKPLVLDR